MRIDSLGIELNFTESYRAQSWKIRETTISVFYGAGTKAAVSARFVFGGTATNITQQQQQQAAGEARVSSSATAPAGVDFSLPVGNLPGAENAFLAPLLY
jgi:hypothetical protein